MPNPFESTDEAKSDDGVKRDRWGRYLLPKYTRIGLAKGKEIGHTRATTFCKSISDTFVLSQWGARMAIKGLAMRPDLYALTAATGLDDRDKLNSIVEDAKAAAGAKSAASLGTALHSFTEQVDRGENPVVPDPWDKDVSAYTALVQAAGITFLPDHVERIVVVDTYGVAGTFDRIGQLTKDLTVKLPTRTVVLKAGTWVIVDLKTGRDLSYGMNEISTQLALYANADAMWNGETGEYEKLPDLNRDVALVIHLPVGKAKAELIGVDIKVGWQAAQLCAHVRDWRKVRGISASIAVGEVELDSTESTIVRPTTWEEKVRSATSKTELSALWTEATKAGEWTPFLAQLGKEQLTKFATP